MAKAFPWDIYNLNAVEKEYFCALSNGDVAGMIKLRNEYDIDPNLVDDKGVSMMHWAAKMGHKDALAYMLSAGADINILTHDGLSPLSYAVMNEKVLTAEWLIEKGADQFLGIDGLPYYNAAGLQGYVEMSEMLKKHYDRGLVQGVQAALIRNDVKEVERLLSLGADIETRLSDDGTYFNCTLLNYASYRGYTDMVRMLLEHGADVHAVDRDGDTSLKSAVNAHDKNSTLDIIHMLMIAGSDPLREDNKGVNARQKAVGDAGLAEALSRVAPVYEEDEIGMQRKLGNRFLEEVYNFASQERISMIRSAQNGPVESFIRESFKDLPLETLTHAFNVYAQKGGKLSHDRALRAALLVDRPFVRKN